MTKSRMWKGFKFTLAISVAWGLLSLTGSLLTTRSPVTAAIKPQADAAQIQRGAYLARAGNCMGCHTVRGGAEMAGGLPIATDYGTIYTTNLTPDVTHGVGSWSRDDFWLALHEGRAKGGRLLYPAFPYPDYTHVTRQDSDDLYAWLQSLPPASQPNRPNELRFPYDTQAALTAWRFAFFTPAPYAPEAGKSIEWNRGAYLVRGLGHCGACHTPRNAFAGSQLGHELQGGMIPQQFWYAPSLTAPDEAGYDAADSAALAGLLKTGATPGPAGQRWLTGPMAEVVVDSTQYLTDTDLQAMTAYTTSLPATPARAREAGPLLESTDRLVKSGAPLYEKHCASCHGADGKGAPGMYPPLAGSRGVTMAESANLIQLTLNGGFAPASQANPRPFGMPPFKPFLTNDEVAAVLTYVRNSWGNRAPEVTPMMVGRLP